MTSLKVADPLLAQAPPAADTVSESPEQMSARHRRQPIPTKPVAAVSSQVGWSAVALFVAFSGEQVWAGSLAVPGANLVAILLVFGGLAALWRIWARPGPAGTVFQLILLASLAVGISYQAALTWLFDPSYGTDAAAFDQYAAWLALHGHNPYTHSMEPSLSMFHVPAVFHTYRLDGNAVTSLSYPAASFLLYVPFLAVGISTQAANIADLVFWFAGMAVVWKALPTDFRWISGILGSALIYVGFIVGGLTDALFVPFVLLAVYQWDRFAEPANTRWTRWVGPIALGVALSVKQTPWFLVPYLLLGLWFEARAHHIRPARLLGKYVSVVSVVFLTFNAPFILADPGAWFRGTLVPFLDPTIPDGQGLINLVLFEHLGGGNLGAFTLLGVVFYAVCLAGFALNYIKLKRAWVPLVAIMFFLPTRSFGSYLFMLIPAALVAATTVRSASMNPFPPVSRHRRTILALGITSISVLACLALTSPAPMTITVLSTRSTGQLQTLDQVTIRVVNRTGHAIHPHFTINADGHATTFWYVRTSHGTSDIVVGPHAETTMTLQAPNTASMPGVNAPLMVEGFTSVPASVSVSARYRVSSQTARIVPDAVDAPVIVGRPITLTVQAENQYGAPIRQAGIPLTLGQTVYGQSAFFPGEARINNHPEGFSPVRAMSNAQGQAIFTVVGVQPQSDPIYFQALIQPPGQIPHGYSNQVSIQFVSAP